VWYDSGSSNLNKCGGPNTFSRTNPAVYRCIPTNGTVTPIGTANGTTVYNLTFTLDLVNNYCGFGIGNCYNAIISPTWSVYFYFCTCPQSPICFSMFTVQFGCGDDYFFWGSR
jgi:hypothetical protein